VGARWGGKRLTDAAGRTDAVGEFAAEGLGEGDVALFEDAVEELGVCVSGCSMVWVQGARDVRWSRALGST
jgi:hypothetical protein